MIVFNNVEVRDHLHLILDHFSALSPDDRYNRFFNTMGPDAIRDWILSVTENSYSHYFLLRKEMTEGSSVCRFWVLFQE